jgi:hypothetical protein
VPGIVGFEAENIVGVDDEIGGCGSIWKDLQRGVIEGTSGVSRKIVASQRKLVRKGADAGESHAGRTMVLSLDGDGGVGGDDRKVLWLDGDYEG